MNIITYAPVRDHGGRYTTTSRKIATALFSGLWWAAKLIIKIASYPAVLAVDLTYPYLPTPKAMLKVVFFQLVILSVLTNGVQFRQSHAIRCAVNHQIVGWFTTKEKCGELEENWFAGERESRMENLSDYNN